ncbi:MAG: cyclic nucleotide-binding domain-containing protein [Deltaproteobacteria bacterium]|nr:cyclic nucleotide-binding domain-containing protein [Deltaproteobacteria bacterium]
MELASGYLFRGLNDRQLERLSGSTASVAMEPGDVIYREGEEAEAIYVLSRGAVELVTSVNNHIELPVSIIRNPGEMFGSSALIEPHRHTLTAKCQSAGNILVIGRRALQDSMSQNHEVGLVIMTNLATYLLSRLQESRQELKIHFKTLLRSFRA